METKINDLKTAPRILTNKMVGYVIIYFLILAFFLFIGIFHPANSKSKFPDYTNISLFVKFLNESSKNETTENFRSPGGFYSYLVARAKDKKAEQDGFNNSFPILFNYFLNGFLDQMDFALGVQIKDKNDNERYQIFFKYLKSNFSKNKFSFGQEGFKYKDRLIIKNLATLLQAILDAIGK